MGTAEDRTFCFLLEEVHTGATGGACRPRQNQRPLMAGDELTAAEKANVPLVP